MVIEDLRMLDGLRRGWEVVKKNVGPVLVIWLITAVIGVVIGLVIALPILVVVVPAIIGFATSQGELPTTASADQRAVLRRSICPCCSWPRAS